MMQAYVLRAGHTEWLFASTTPGLEGVLAREARALGTVVPVPGGVELRGPAGLHRQANLRLRTASRVLLRVGSVPAGSREALQRGLAGLPLQALRPPEGFALASVESHRSRLSRRELESLLRPLAPHPLGEARGEGGVDPAAPPAGPVGLYARLEGERCTLSVDTSGELLYRRGYRQEVSRAPLRETLAAGVLLLAGYEGTEPLVDPMCGSGTFLVEGAWLSLGRAPGLARRFAFERFPSHDAAAWEREKAAAVAAERAVAAPLLGSDINAGSLGTARRNARRAGVLERLQLERRDVAALVAPPGPPGLVVVNPPYGKRVGEERELAGLYRTLGEVLRGRFGGWRAAVLVPEVALERALGFPSPERHAVDNGGLRLQLLVQAL